MKKLLFLFVLLTSLSKAQNDSITYFAYTDYNNNCFYEPGMGEEPLKHFGFDFIYKYGTGFYQFNSKTTDDYGYVKFYATGAMAPASNTLTVKSCGSPFPSQFSACYNPVDLTYNTTYSVGVYSPAGPSAFNYFSVYSVFSVVSIQFFASGRRTQKVLPLPSTELTSILPLWARTIQ